MPVYSFGADSPLKFEITDEFAATYNAATDDFMQAQIAHKERTGKDWSPEQALFLQHSTAAAFDTFAEILAAAISAYGKPIYENELTDIHLIKN